MKTIHKFPLKEKETQHLSMPQGAKIICVQAQNDTLTLWALVDDSKEPEKREIRIYGTGQEVNEYDLEYIGTLQQALGYVWHVFENK